MTPTELAKRALELYGPYKKYPNYFVDYPAVNELLDICPEIARALIKREAVLKTVRDLFDHMLTELQGSFAPRYGLDYEMIVHIHQKLEALETEP